MVFRLTGMPRLYGLCTRKLAKGGRETPKATLRHRNIHSGKPLGPRQVRVKDRLGLCRLQANFRFATNGRRSEKRSLRISWGETKEADEADLEAAAFHRMDRLAGDTFSNETSREVRNSMQGMYFDPRSRFGSTSKAGASFAHTTVIRLA